MLPQRGSSQNGKNMAVFKVPMHMYYPDDTVPVKRRRLMPNILPDAGEYSEVLCDVCHEIYRNAHATPCGHIFCKECIQMVIRETKHCPRCRKVLNQLSSLTYQSEIQDRADNHRIEFQIDLFLHKRGYEVETAVIDTIVEHFMAIELKGCENVEKRADEVRTILGNKKRVIGEKNRKEIRSLLEEFVKFFIRKRDYEATEAARLSIHAKRDFLHLTGQQNLLEQIPEMPKLEKPKLTSQQLVAQYASLEDCYVKNLRNCGTSLPSFENTMREVLRFSSIRSIASLDHARGIPNNGSIVSAIEFDRDNQYFVVAGIANQMKIYNFETVIDRPQTAGVLANLPTSSKVSCASWNQKYHQFLANSDYNGLVQIWDTEREKLIHTYMEHEKRCWSVQFNTVAPHYLASGSDDMKVKIWSVHQGNSLVTINPKVHVCCVAFNPQKEHEIAFGGSDHLINIYDWRHIMRPLKVLHEHRKAISYVKFVDANRLVSASTDSTLRMWDIEKEQSINIFEGHLNEKNFVGLAVNGEHIACGSESNEVYTYYSQCSRPIAKYDFASLSHFSELGSHRQWENTPSPNQPDFVSAVCWKRDSNLILASNNAGQLHILQAGPKYEPS